MHPLDTRAIARPHPLQLTGTSAHSLAPLGRPPQTFRINLKIVAMATRAHKHESP